MMPCHSFLHQHLKRRHSRDVFYRGQGNLSLKDTGCLFYDYSTAACMLHTQIFRFRVTVESGSMKLAADIRGSLQDEL